MTRTRTHTHSRTRCRPSQPAGEVTRSAGASFENYMPPSPQHVERASGRCRHNGDVGQPLREHTHRIQPPHFHRAVIATSHDAAVGEHTHSLHLAPRQAAPRPRSPPGTHTRTRTLPQELRNCQRGTQGHLETPYQPHPAHTPQIGTMFLLRLKIARAAFAGRRVPTPGEVGLPGTPLTSRAKQRTPPS